MLLPNPKKKRKKFKGGIDNNNESAQYAHSLNRDRRRRELQRITKQNLQILTRIEESRPTYDHHTWEEEARAKDRIMINICEFKNGCLVKQVKPQNDHMKEKNFLLETTDNFF
jgi:hypothetical protein